ncbi:tyrosine-type recombinase/integrase [Rickettsiales bacterium LUAb2]
MNLYKRGNVWWVSFTLNKHQYRLSTQQNTRVLATEVANALYNRYKDVVINKKVSFKQVADKYLTLRHYEGLSKASKASYQSTIKDANIFFQNKDFFSFDILTNYLEYLINVKKHSNKTLKEYFLILGKMCKECIKIGFIKENPITQIDLTSYKIDNKKERHLSKEERLQIKEHCIKYMQLDILDYIEFAVETGLRVMEQLKLTWDRINLNDKDIYITETKNKKNRTVPLTPLALQILLTRKSLNRPFPIPKDTLYSKWTKLKEEIKLNEHITWHDLRRTFSTWSLKGWHDWQNGNSMPLGYLQKWMGHSDIRVTMRYSHLSIEDLKSLVKESN